MTTSNAIQIGPMQGGGTTTAVSTSSTAAAALGKGGGGYMFVSVGCNSFVQLGISTVGAAAATTGNFAHVIPSGQALVITVPDSVTHFRVITDSGSGALYWGKVNQG